MRRPSVSPLGPACLAPLLFAALALTSACSRQSAKAEAAPTPAGSPDAVRWDFASADPARNPYVANKEANTPGYNP